MVQKLSRISICVLFGLVCLGLGVRGTVVLAARFTRMPAEPQAVQANEGKNLELVTQLGGEIDAMDFHNNLAYLGIGERLVVSDFTDPAHPVVVGQTEMLSVGLRYLRAVQGYVYAIGNDISFRVFNVTDPAQPVLTGGCALPNEMPYLPYNLAVFGDTAYVAVSSGIRIIDVSDPAKPIEVGSYAITHPVRLLLEEPYLYVASGDGVSILSLADPLHPVQAGFYAVYMPAYLAVSGSYLYSASSYSGLTILDIADPANPSQVGVYPDLKFPKDIAVYGAYVLITRLQDSVLIVDVSDPANPVMAGSYDAYDAGAVSIDGSRAYTLATQGIYAMDLSTLPAPVDLGSYDPPQGAQGIAISGTLAYVSFSNQFSIFDVSNPITPTLIGYTTTARNEVAVYGDYAYLGGYLSSLGIQIIDIHDPHNPFSAGIYWDGSVSYYSEMIVSGSYLYGVSHAYMPHFPLQGGLAIFDLSDPVHLSQVGGVNATGLGGVAISGNYAYLANSKTDPYGSYVGGLIVVDISNPADPIPVGEYDCEDVLGTGAHDVAVRGSYVYLSCTEGLYALDVSDPVNPQRVGYLNIPYAGSLVVDGHHLYLQGWVVDISDPARMVEIGQRNVWGIPAISSGYLFMAAGRSGLEILHLTNGSISGRVRDIPGNPVPDVRIQADTGFTTTTGVDGSYTLQDLPPARYTITPTLSGYAFWPPARSVVPSYDSLHQDFTLLPLPVSITLTPGLTSTLILTDTQGLTTTLLFPAGAVTETVSLTLTPTVGASQLSWVFAGHAFELVVSREGVVLPDFAFNAPVIVTIRYSDADLRLVRAESQLALWQWVEAAWQDAAQVCDPSSGYSRDENGNLISLAICHTGRFKLMGPTFPTFLPVVSTTR